MAARSLEGHGGHGHSHGGHGHSHGGHDGGHGHAHGEHDGEACDGDHAHGKHDGGHGHSHGGEACDDDHAHDEHGHSHDSDGGHGHSHDGGGHGHAHGSQDSAQAARAQRERIQAYMNDTVCRHPAHTDRDAATDADTVDECALAAEIKRRDESVALNPAFPLPFERIGDGPIDDEYEAEQRPQLGLLLREDDPTLVKPEFFGRQSVYDAFMAAYEAPTDDPVRAREVAERALAIDAVCPVAYFVLGAVCATSIEEAEQAFDKAIAMTNSAEYCPEFRTVVQRGHLWSCVPLRCYFRAICGRMNTLRKRGNYAAALTLTEMLEMLEHRRPSLSKCLINYRLFVPELHIRLGKPAEALKHIKSAFAEFDLRLSRTCGPFWAWCELLCEYLLYHKQTDACIVNPAVQPRSRAFGLCMQFPQLMEYIAGEKPLPGNRPRMEIFVDQQHVLDQQLNKSEYLGAFSSLVSLWQGEPGAARWLVRNVNTYLCTMMLQLEAGIVLRLSRLFAGFGEPGFFAQCARKGVYAREMVSTSFTLLHMAVLQSRPLSAQYAKVLLENGADSAAAPGKRPISPLHLVCYYDGDIEVLRLLTEAGASVTAAVTGQELVPLAMAADQSNWRIIEYVLRTKAGLRKQDTANLNKLMGMLAERTLKSGVAACLRGGPKCMRCRSNDMPHSAEASPERVIDVLFEAGMTLADVSRDLIQHPIMQASAGFKRLVVERLSSSLAATALMGGGGGGVIANACAVCRKTGAALQQCSRCQKVKYCSRECQKSDWPQHKSSCAK